jgi:hypothetical protein
MDVWEPIPQNNYFGVVKINYPMGLLGPSFGLELLGGIKDDGFVKSQRAKMGSEIS